VSEKTWPPDTRNPSKYRVIDYVGRGDDPDEIVYIDLKEDGTPLNKDSISYRRKDKDGFYSTTWFRDPRAFYCAICGHGWDNSCKSLRNSMFLNDAPEGKECVHNTCYLGHLGMVQHGLFYWAICEGNIRDGIRMLFNGLKIKPNQYGGAYNTPWYTTDIVGLSLGESGDWKRRKFKAPNLPTLELGRRKRVYSMFLKSPVKLVIERNEDTKHIFDDDTTKIFGETHIYENKFPKTADSILIHAWTDEKVQLYMKAFCSILYDNMKDVLEEYDGNK